jgi:putative ABC transport system permease protein
LGEHGGKTRGAGYLRVVARLKPAVPIEQARAEMSGLTRRIAREHRQNAPLEGRTVDLASAISGEARKPLRMLLGSVGLLLLIACANIASLLLARAAERRHEFAIRAALGCARARLLRQVITESMLLSIAGGALGLVFAFWTRDALGALARSYVPVARPIELDGWVLAFAAFLALVTGLLFGLLPALEASGASVGDALKSASRASRLPHMRSILVVAEVALTLVLLTTAGLLLRSFWKVQSQELGFQPQRVLTGEVRLKRGQDATAYNLSFMTDLISRVKRLPGVETAAMVEAMPLSGRNNDMTFTIEGRPDPPPNAPRETMMNFCTPEYFRLMQMRLLRGRFFDDRDGAGAPAVIVINETLAQRYFPDEDPVGKRVKLTSKWQTIAGVVADVRHRSLTGPLQAQVYFPYAQHALPRMTLAVRTAGDPAILLKSIRRELGAMDPNLPLGNARTIDQLLDEAVAPRRLSMLLLASLAGLAMALAAVGIYGVISYSVAQRTREIGVRIALGAQPADVLSLVLRQGTRVVAAGLLLGFAISMAVSRSLGAVLFAVAPHDPLTLLACIAMLFAVALAAMIVPARRATRVDPALAMRCD